MGIEISDVEIEGKKAKGLAASWEGGQYVAIQTEKGFVGCGIYSIDVAEEFGFAVALAKGTPENPLKVPEDLLGAKVIATTSKAKEYGIKEGMSGEEALKRLM